MLPLLIITLRLHCTILPLCRSQPLSLTSHVTRAASRLSHPPSSLSWTKHRRTRGRTARVGLLERTALARATRHQHRSARPCALFCPSPCPRCALFCPSPCPRCAMRSAPPPPPYCPVFAFYMCTLFRIVLVIVVQICFLQIPFFRLSFCKRSFFRSSFAQSCPSWGLRRSDLLFSRRSFSMDAVCSKCTF